MKKIIYALCTIMLIFTFAGFKTKEVKQPLTFVNSESLKYQATFDPHSKTQYIIDSTAFANKYIQSGQFIKSASFPLYIADMYSQMQTNLGITASSETDAKGNQVINGIRIYPAIENNAATGKKILYMVFMGEESTADASGASDVLNSTTMQTSSYYKIYDGQFTELNVTETAQAKLDIKNFQSFWNTEFPGSTPTSNPSANANVNRSFSTSISQYYQLLNGSNLDIYSGLTNATLKYGIIFYPCIENNKLIFVNKGFQENNTGAILTFENKNFYDHMDVCPDKCPTNEIQ